MPPMTRNRNDVEQEMRDTLGMIPGFFDRMPDEVLNREWDEFKQWEIGETLIPNKYKQLLMLAIHAETRCQYCTLFHTELAKMFGATEDEITEAVLLAKHTVGTSTYINGIRYDYDQFESELHQIGEYMMEPA
jgi:AhpD family alkylhydroperoxidase